MEVRSMLTGILSRRNTASHRWSTKLRAIPLSPPHQWISFPPFPKNKNRRIPFVVFSRIKASMFPTAALSTSGIRVEGLSFLSACCNKLPCIFSCKTKTGDNLFGASCKKLCLSLPTAALSASGLRVEACLLPLSPTYELPCICLCFHYTLVYNQKQAFRKNIICMTDVP